MDFTISNRAKGANFEVRAVVTVEKKLTDSEAVEYLTQVKLRLSRKIPVNLRPKFSDTARDVIVSVRARDQHHGEVIMVEVRTCVTEAIRVTKHHIQLSRLAEQGDL